MEITIKGEMYNLTLVHSLVHLTGSRHLLGTIEYTTKQKGY